MAPISGSLQAAEPPPTLVFAAASLTNVLQELGERFETASGKDVVFSFAGSMTLARQIEASSGADIFIAADRESMDYLDGLGLIARATRRNVLANRIVLIAPRDVDPLIELGLDELGLGELRPEFPLRAALGDGRLALANTLSVPAGRYARAALASLGVWESVSERLAEGEDVRTALAFVARGDAPLGIVYATDAQAEPRVRIVGRFPAASHPPIVYPAALTTEAGANALAFLQFLGGTEAGMVFARAGFETLAAP